MLFRSSRTDLVRTKKRIETCELCLQVLFLLFFRPVRAHVGNKVRKPVSGMPFLLTFPGDDFNITCFWRKNVLSLYCESMEGGRNRPFFVQKRPFPGKTGPMMGFRRSHVVRSTWLVVFSGPIRSEK